MGARTERWMKITGLTLTEISGLAREAACAYDEGRTGWGSGFGVGNECSHYLPLHASDHRIRAWGDFLIDHGYSLA